MWPLEMTLKVEESSGGCQYLGRRLVSWQCKKQTIVAISSIEAEYVAAASCCAQTKHIQIRHHFIRDCYEERLINVVKVHTDDNVADLLTKGFDLARFKFLVVTIGLGLTNLSLNSFYVESTAASQGTAATQGTAASQKGTADIPKS
ncbi:hypothetical protein Tco_0146839, partial [Tanacetum coccineum]